MKFVFTKCISIILLSMGIVSSHAQSTSGQKSNDVLKLIGSANSPRSFTFCDADKNARQCKNSKGLKAGGLGGAFIPLGLELKSFRIVNRKTNGNSAQIVSKLDTLVNGIAPKCKNSESTISASSKKLEFKGFYCNWLAIGNVVANVTLDIQDVDTRRKTFSGKYTIRLVGTGNMFGKGHFIARAS